MTDPDKILADMLEIVRGIDTMPTKANSAMDILKFALALDKVDRLCELVKELDAHMSKGGQLPRAWRR